MNTLTIADFDTYRAHYESKGISREHFEAALRWTGNESFRSVRRTRRGRCGLPVTKASPLLEVSTNPASVKELEPGQAVLVAASGGIRRGIVAKVGRTRAHVVYVCQGPGTVYCQARPADQIWVPPAAA